MEDDDKEWPFGPYLTQAITQDGRSKRAIARAAGISEGYLRQLELGYQRRGDLRIPINTTPKMVRAVARTLGLNLAEAYEKAGFDREAKVESVGAIQYQDEPDEDVDSLRFRRPDGMSDREWNRYKASKLAEWNAMVDEIAKERD